MTELSEIFLRKFLKNDDRNRANDTLHLQLRRVVKIQGKKEVAFENLATQLGLEEDFARQVVFDIKVKEANTGRIQNVTATYNMYRHK